MKWWEVGLSCLAQACLAHRSPLPTHTVTILALMSLLVTLLHLDTRAVGTGCGFRWDLPPALMTTKGWHLPKHSLHVLWLKGDGTVVEEQQRGPQHLRLQLQKGLAGVDSSGRSPAQVFRTRGWLSQGPASPGNEVLQSKENGKKGGKFSKCKPRTQNFTWGIRKPPNQATAAVFRV